tara:strand:+ start:104 stop:553 length:450 start_codon:yes stop_codon:yes gene_type:complete
MSVNKVILVGNLTQMPEIKQTSTGGVVALLNLATNENWTDKNTGEKVERSEYHRVTCFNKVAEIVQKLSLGIGSKLYVEGQLTHRDYVDKTGIKKYITEVKLSGFGSTIQVLSAKQTPQEKFSVDENLDVAPNKIVPVGKEEFDDDIPF